MEASGKNKGQPSNEVTVRIPGNDSIHSIPMDQWEALGEFLSNNGGFEYLANGTEVEKRLYANLEVIGLTPTGERETATS